MNAKAQERFRQFFSLFIFRSYGENLLARFTIDRRLCLSSLWKEIVNEIVLMLMCIDYFDLFLLRIWPVLVQTVLHYK